MYFPQLDTPPQQQPPRKRTPESGIPDWCILAALWLFSATLGAFFGYLPPRFQPAWLYRTVLASVFLAWSAIGVLLLVYGSRVMFEKATGLVLLLVAVVGLWQVFTDPDFDPSRNDA